jgi:hypothetical protein
MSEVVRWFQVGGLAMFPILLLGIVGLAGTIVGLAIGVSSRRRGTPLAFGIALLVVAVLCGGIGGLSYAMARQKVDAALVAVDPGMREELRSVGNAEARVAPTFGASAAALPGLGGLVLVALGLARGREPGAGV